MEMATVNSIDIKDEFDEETFGSISNDVFPPNEEIAQTEITSKAMFFENPTFIKIEDPEENSENPIIADEFPSGNECFQKEERTHICLICGSNATTTEFSHEKWMANENWRKECAETVCDVLLTSDSDHFNQFFQIAQYCSSCQKLIWKADFTRRRIISLQKTIDKLSIALRRKFALNFIQLKASQRPANAKVHHSSLSKNVGLPQNFSINEVTQRIYTENSSAFDYDAHTRTDVPLRLFTKSKIADNINSKPKAKRSKTKNKRLTNLKKRTVRALETNQAAGVPRKPGPPKKEIVNSQRKKKGPLLVKSSTASENNAEFCDYENDYSRSPDDNCEVEERENSPENQTQWGLENDSLNSEEIVARRQGNPSQRFTIEDTRLKSDELKDYTSNHVEANADYEAQILENDILNSEGRVTRRQRKPPKRFTIEDTRLKSNEIRDDILSDDDEEQPKKTRKGSKQEHEDEEDYVPEEGARTDMEKWWYQKAKERFKRRNPNPTTFSCPIEGCNNKYKKNLTLQHHIRTIHEGINLYHCDFCPKTFYTKTKLGRHKMTHPEYNITINDPKYLKPIREYEFSCSICGQGYNSEEELTAHNEIHAGANPFVCLYCKKECTNASELKAHISLEHDEETPKCNFCGKTFVSNRSLEQHKKIHLKPEDCFTCPHCPYITPFKSSINSHVTRLHGESEGVQCETCGKTLKHVKALRNHMKTHLGEKPYKCRVCEKSFTTLGIRNRHETIHSGIRPHVCSFCGKALTTADNLKVHELIHTRDPNVPLPKRIYKKPFPKKKKKVKPPVDNDADNSSAQSQSTVPTLSNSDGNDSFPSIVSMSQSTEMHSFNPNDSQIQQYNNLQYFSQTQMP